jgi:hypothetical protein
VTRPGRSALRSPWTGCPPSRNATRPGDCGLEHVAAIAPVVPDIPEEKLKDGGDALLGELTATLNPSELRRAAERIRAHVAPVAAERDDAARRAARWLSVSRTLDGCLAVQGILDPEGGEQLLTTLQAFTPPPAADDTRSPRQRRADALVEACRQATATAPTCGGQPPTLVVTLDLADLAGRTGRAPRTPHGRWTGVTFASGARVDAATLRRLACDCNVIPAVLGGAGEPLDLGRSRRLVSPAQRRALVLRDGRCRFPGCDRPSEWTDAHHLTPWWKGGRTNVNEMVLLCRRHHRIVHDGQWTLTYHRDTGDVTATDRTGRPHPLISKSLGHSP